MRNDFASTDLPLDPASTTHALGVTFPAGNNDFREVRNRCAQACRDFNTTPENAAPEVRSRKWNDIVRPCRNAAADADDAVTHDQTFANPALRATTPFVKPPIYIDYGVRLKVGGSTFINRNCMIMDTPVADVIIGEGCNVGPNCHIISVTHPIRLDERQQKHSIGHPITIGNNVWIGANVTILGGVRIGDGAVIGASSLVNKDIPPMTMAYGVPARVVGFISDLKPSIDSYHAVGTLKEALDFSNSLSLESCREGMDAGSSRATTPAPLSFAEPHEREQHQQSPVSPGPGDLLLPQKRRAFLDLVAIGVVAAVVLVVLLIPFVVGVHVGRGCLFLPTFLGEAIDM